LLSISPCHNQELTPSTAYTKYRIHWAQNTPSTAYTAYCIIPRSTVSHSQPVPQLSADHVFLNSLNSHNYKLTNEYSLRSLRASLPNYCLQIDCLLVLLESRSIMASKCISKLARSQPLGVSLFSHDHGLHVCTITAAKCISTLAWSRSPNSLHRGLQGHLQTCLITA